MSGGACRGRAVVESRVTLKPASHLAPSLSGPDPALQCGQPVCGGEYPAPSTLTSGGHTPVSTTTDCSGHFKMSSAHGEESEPKLLAVDRGLPSWASAASSWEWGLEGASRPKELACLKIATRTRFLPQSQGPEPCDQELTVTPA